MSDNDNSVRYGLDGDEEEDEGATTRIHKAENDSSLSTASSSSAAGSGVSGGDGESSSRESKSSTDEKNGEDAEGKGKSGIHPFIQSKPPFNAQFPLSYFDNSEYDIRSGEDWCRLGWEDKEKRFYPLPGKAFLPLPLQPDKRAKARSPAEMTLEEILKKTPRLERFRQWLLRERFQRQIRMVGLDPHKGTYESNLACFFHFQHCVFHVELIIYAVTRLTPSEMEMAIVARLGSTVETLASLSDDSIEEIHRAVKRFSQRSKMDGELEDLSYPTIPAVGSDEGEEGEGEGQSSSDPDLNTATETKDEDQLNIVFKLRQPKRDDDASEDDDKGLTTNDDAKKYV